MPMQNTFTLVPTAAALAPRNPMAARPMTSKQVSKAYKTANRAPKISRAERMRQERAEQERIRKELEREKSAAKAKAARDRKREQEKAEREERRRNGRPLVDVRSSQNTMTSFFARGAKKRPEANQPEHPEQEAGQTLQGLEEIAEDPAEDAGATSDAQVVAPLAKEDPQKLDPSQLLLDDVDFDIDVDDIDFDLLEADHLNRNDLCEDTTLEPFAKSSTSLVISEAQKPTLHDAANKEAIHEPTTTRPGTEISRKETQYERDLGLGLAKKRKWEDPKPCEQASREQPAAVMAPPPKPSPPSLQFNLDDIDDLFPTASQQIREIEEDILTPFQQAPAQPAVYRPVEQSSKPTSPSPAEAAAPNPSPRRFFTDSGSQELMSLALHRSRRSANLEALQQKDRMRVEAGMLQQQEELLAKREMNHQAKKWKGSPERMPAKTLSVQQQHKQAPVSGKKLDTSDSNNKKPEMLKQRSRATTVAVQQSRQSPVSSTGIEKQHPADKRLKMSQDKPPAKTPEQPQPKQRPSQNHPQTPSQAQKRHKTSQETYPPKPPPAQQPSTPLGETSRPKQPPEHRPGKKAHSENKENIPPPAAPSEIRISLLSASQEADYDSQWLDDIDIELLL